MKRILLFFVALLVASAFNLTSGQSSGDTGFHPDYLNFTAVNGSASVKLSTVGNNPPSCSFQYSTDDCSTWNNYSIGTQINLASGTTVYLKATTTNNSLSSYTSGGTHKDGYYYSIAGYHHFEMMGTVEAHGNTMSLLTSTLTQTSVPAYAFYRLFECCTGLTTAPSLPATQLGEGCYYSMFWGCTALRETPELSATSTVAYCYNYMFYACQKLPYPPALPATNLSDYCYYRMLEFCYDITLDSTGTGTPWSIPAGLTPASHWGDGMFNGTGGQFNGQDAPTIGKTYYYRLPVYTVTALPNNSVFGTVTGGGSFTPGDTATLTATPKPNYHFVNWSNGDTTLTISFPVNGDTTLTANFAADPEYLHFTAVNGSGSVTLSLMDYYQTNLFQYSTDSCHTWYDYTVGTRINLASGATVYFKAKTYNGALGRSLFNYRYHEYYQFQMTGTIEAHGNIMSLLDATMTQTHVPSEAFGYLFYNCSSLVTAPYLPATQLGNYCYEGMFYGTSIVEAPELPATTLMDYCYSSMFVYCNKLQKAPELNAMSLAKSCYSYMFRGCSSLNETPLLPATTLAQNCYSYMFEECSRLLYPPVLPATELYSDCYSCMFRNCTSIALEPTGPGNTWSIPASVGSTFTFARDMFTGTNGTLQGAPVPGQIYYYQLPDYTVTTSVNNATMGSVTAGGTYSALSPVTLTATTNPGYHFVGWSNGETDSTITIHLTKDTALTAIFASHDYLRFTAVKHNGSVKLDTLNSNVPSCSFQYSTDFGATWINYPIGLDIQLTPGQMVCFKATTTNGALASSHYHDEGMHRFVINGPIAAHGNIMSLLDANLAQTSVPANAFFELFKECRTLLTAPSLPATQLGNYCYASMFENCNALLKAPALNAMTLAEGCYSYMFTDCGSLVIPPALPATTLAKDCYDNMFFLCSKLAFPPALPATTLAPGCYNEMFYSCSSISLFPTGTGRTWSIPAGTTTASNWGYKMFYGTSGTMQGTPVIGQTYYLDTLVHVVAIPNDTAMGTIEGRGTYNLLDTVTLTAVPKPGYHFVSWSNGDTTLTISFVGIQDTIITANFAVTLDYLRFKAVNGNATVKLITELVNPPSCSFQYSTDSTTTWRNYTIGSYIQLADGATVYFKATTTNGALASVGSHQSDGIHRFVMTGTIEAHGNVMSLLDAAMAQTSAPDHAFRNLFSDCSSMITAPSLPATQLGVYCYKSMFQNCYNLTEVPELPATVMKEGCYYSMFESCKKLRKAPVLNSTSLAQACYVNMFKGCESLVIPPALPATTIATSCYPHMFEDCKSLAFPPALPATVLTPTCYLKMFKGCTSLSLDTTGAGYTWSIPATAIPPEMGEDNWGTDMFLNTAGTLQGQPVIGRNYYFAFPARTVTATVNDTTMGSVTGGGSYVMTDTATLTATPKSGHHFVNWSNGETTRTIRLVVAKDTTLTANFAVNPDYLRFTAVNGNGQVSLDNMDAPSRSFQYSTDSCTTWRDYHINDIIYLSSGATVYFKATTHNGALARRNSSNYIEHHNFRIYGQIEAHGNIMSLLDEDLTQTSVPDYAFSGLFDGCAGLLTAPSLPATQLGISCYEDMFAMCPYLEQAPALNAATMAQDCYRNMFYRCTGIIEPPVLPATTLALGCYSYMFVNCTSLAYPPALTATSLADYCYNSMFYGCSAITLNTSGTGNTWSIPANASSATGWGRDMFYGTSGTLQGEPTIGHIYYSLLPLYTVTTIVNDSTMGSVAGGGSYSVLDTVTLTAIPAANHHFTGWSNGETNPTISFVLKGNTAFAANFAASPTYLFEESDTICQGDTLRWRNMTLTESGVYRDSLRTVAYGADSIYQMTLIANASYLIAQSATVCQGTPYVWRGRDFHQSGVYRDSFLTTQGCDSIYQLTLSITPRYHFTDTAEICQGDSFAWRGHFYSVGGTYYDSYYTVSGCDSIYELYLIVRPRFITPYTQTICQGDTFVWRNRALTSTGIYSDTLSTVYGCDSIFMLALLVNSKYLVRESGYLCTGSTYYPWHGRMLTAPGTYFDSLQTHTGCDSIFILTLMQAVSYTMTDTMSICNEPAVWRGKTITMPGTYYDSLVAVTGCDSVYVLNVGLEQYTVTATADDESHGYVSGGGTYTCGDEVTVTALPYQNYRFVSWNNGSTSSTLTFNIYEDTTLIAYFEVAQGVDNVNALNLEVASQGGYLLLKGAEGHGVMVYDAVGKMIANIDEAEEFETVSIPVAGVYILRVDNGQTLRVIVK